MQRGEKILLTATGFCRGAEFATTPQIISRNTKPGKPVISIEGDGQVSFTCDQEAASGECFLSPRGLPCAVRPIFRRGAPSENIGINRKTITIRDGRLDYDPTEKIIYDWPNKPPDEEPKRLRAEENIVLDYLTRNPGQTVTHYTFFKALWPETIPDTGREQLEKYISDLEAKIGPDAIDSIDEIGYRLLEPDIFPSTKPQS